MAPNVLRFPCLKASFLIMGLSGIVAQIILLREMLVSFYGNELTLGIILANWLVLEAIGSFFIGGTVEKTKCKLEVYTLLQLIFSIAFPAALYFSRVFKNILLAPPGEAVGFVSILSFSLLVLLPVAIPHGALFTYGSKLYSQYAEDGASSIGKVYLLETLGMIVGGLLITYFLIEYMDSFQIAFVISLLNSILSVLLLLPLQRLSVSPLRAVLWGSSLLLSLLSFSLLLSPAAKQIHWASIRSQWKNMGIIHNENSVYGNISVIRRGEQFTFFTNGIPALTTPVPDVASIEDFVHFPMLFHERPQSVLILSGGAGGLIHEVLKHGVSRIDYVELDPLLLRLVKQFSTPMTRSELSDPRVRVHYTDGRSFIHGASDRFDIIFVGLSVPQELQTNRYFSSEFFSIVRTKMNPDGILALALPGSSTYLAKELKDVNGCILDTLNRDFPCVRIIPGDTNLFLASNSRRIEGITAVELFKRLESRQVQTRLITRAYLEDRLHDRWQRWFSQSMEGRATRINSDFHPLAVFFGLTYWNALFSPRLTRLFHAIEMLTLKQTLATLSVLSLLVIIVFIIRPSASIQSVPYAIFSTGLTGMVFSLSILLSFQTLYGYLYHQIGLLVALFMTGVALGSFLMTARLNRIAWDSLLFLGTEFGLILFSLVLPFLFLGAARHFQGSATGALLGATFWGSSLLSGFLMGLQFPLATKIYFRHHLPIHGTLSRTAGLIYGVDLVGGFVGGLLGGVFLLPLLGLEETCFTVGMIKTSSFLFFSVFTWITRRTPIP